MKKGTVTAIALSVAALILLGVLTIYLTMQHKEDLFAAKDAKTQAEADADAVLQTLHASQSKTDASGTDGGADSETDKLFTIWAGDSRTIGMRDAVANDDIYIGASGEGYDWLSQIGLPQIEDAIDAHPDAPVVFNFGVNDYDNLDRYLELYQSLAQEYPDTHFYFLSVNPIDPEVCVNITNEEIADFNSHLQQTFPDTYIDSFSFLMMNETATIDGIHYSQDDYRMIHDFAAQAVKETEDR